MVQVRDHNLTPPLPFFSGPTLKSEVRNIKNIQCIKSSVHLNNNNNLIIECDKSVIEINSSNKRYRYYVKAFLIQEMVKKKESNY